MRKAMLALTLLALPAFLQAEEVWRWQDGNGVIHYSNVVERVPATAEPVKTRLIREVRRLPDSAVPELDLSHGMVVESVDPAPAPGKKNKPHRIYDEERLRRGCFTAGVLYFGGWAHADDISPVLNCLPYMFGPEAWLNAARAELAMRQAGISPGDLFSAPAR